MLNYHFLRNAFLDHPSPTRVKLDLLIISSNNNRYQFQVTINLSRTCLYSMGTGMAFCHSSFLSTK